MKNLKPHHVKVLNTISDYPQGLLLSQIQSFVGIKSKQLSLYYLNFLIAKKMIEKRSRLYFAIPHAGSAKPFTQLTQRPHAMRAAARIYRSHMDRAQATLEAKGIRVKTTLKGSCMDFYWRSINLKLFKNGRLEIRPSLPEYPLNVPLETILSQAAHEAGVYIEAFLSETGLKCIRDKLFRLAIEITYWENGYPKNEIAENTAKNQKIVYAYDKQTGKQAIWADMSLNPFIELETNSARADPVIKKMMQGINDGEIDPYEDIIETRRNIAALTQIQETNTKQIAEYAKQIELHLGVMKQIDKRLTKLNQRRLFE